MLLFQFKHLERWWASRNRQNSTRVSPESSKSNLAIIYSCGWF